MSINQSTAFRQVEDAPVADSPGRRPAGPAAFTDTCARLTLTSEPTGASVWIDDEDTGLRTPREYVANLKRDKSRSIYVELRLTGFKDYCAEVELRRGETLPFGATLAPAVRLNPVDGAEMVYVPAGEIIMGSDDIKDAPKHIVYLDAYWIYKTPVTVAQYRKFCQTTKRNMPKEPKWGWHDDHPIVNVNWKDASAYTKWSNGLLPTEAQWEKAARGTDRRLYPWGNDWNQTLCACSKNKLGDLGCTKPVGSYPRGASPYGAPDMAGNVWEWCSDWYGKEYYGSSTSSNPTGPVDGVYRVLRGGSWIGVSQFGFRAAIRIDRDPTNGYGNYGFRCAVRPDSN